MGSEFFKKLLFLCFPLFTLQVFEATIYLRPIPVYINSLSYLLLIIVLPSSDNLLPFDEPLMLHLKSSENNK